jgi:hypothetical protein
VVLRLEFNELVYKIEGESRYIRMVSVAVVPVKARL